MKKSAIAAEGGERPQLVWHKPNSTSMEGRVFKLGNVYRARVPGGWLVMVADNAREPRLLPGPRARLGWRDPRRRGREESPSLTPREIFPYIVAG